MTTRLLPVSLRLVFAAAAAALPLSATMAEPVELRYEWKDGQTERFEMSQVSQSRISAGAGASQGQTTQTHSSVVELHVEDVAESGAATVRWTVEKVRVEIRQIVGQPMVLDSQNPEHRKNPNSIPLFAMIGRPVTFTITPDGKVSDVKGVEAVLADLKESYKDHPSAEQIIPTLDQGFTNEQMHAQIEKTLNVLPPRPVEVGDTWQRTTEMEAPIIGTIRTEETNRLVAIRESSDGPIAEIRADATLTPLKQAEDAPTKMMDSTATHELLFDIDKGMVNSYVIESNMDLVGTPPGGEQTTAKISTKTSLSRINQAAAPAGEEPAPTE